MTFDKLVVLLRAREQELTAIYENIPGIVFYIAVLRQGCAANFAAFPLLSLHWVRGNFASCLVPLGSRSARKSPLWASALKSNRGDWAVAIHS
jgi:hypothetical protein